MSEELPEIAKCARCGEDAIHRCYRGEHWVTVRRRSKCKHYNKKGVHPCRTELFNNQQDAVEDWNMHQAVTDPAARNPE